MGLSEVASNLLWMKHRINEEEEQECVGKWIFREALSTINQK